MTRFSRLIIECAWCQRLMGVSEPTRPGQTGTSHTICPGCADRVMRKEQQS